jgi:hypothetical protein
MSDFILQLPIFSRVISLISGQHVPTITRTLDLLYKKKKKKEKKETNFVLLKVYNDTRIFLLYVSIYSYARLYIGNDIFKICPIRIRYLNIYFRFVNKIIK